jgi:hypothetical protein
MKKNNSKKNLDPQGKLKNFIGFKCLSGLSVLNNMNWSLRMFFKVLFIALILQCANNSKEKPVELQGLWGFLDAYGNYNEAYFDATSYKTMNRFVSDPPMFNYWVQNDTLFSDVDKRKSGMNPVAAIQWLDADRVVFTGEFVSDTLYRLKGVSIHPGNSDPIKDSIIFWPAFYARYEAFLISRGIISEEDAIQFRESGRIPEDVLKEMKQ